jgi:hypothetical protein
MVEALPLPLVAIGGPVDGFIASFCDHTRINRGVLFQFTPVRVKDERPRFGSGHRATKAAMLAASSGLAAA